MPVVDHHVVGDGADSAKRHVDSPERLRLAVDQKRASAKSLLRNGRGRYSECIQRGGVSVPGHQIDHWPPLAHEISSFRIASNKNAAGRRGGQNAPSPAPGKALTS